MFNLQKPKIIFFLMAYLLLAQPVTADNKNDTLVNDNYVQLQTENNQKFSAYIVGPEKAKQGILLIHGWWGLTQEVETWANQYAVKGYRVMAVDLYNKQVTKNPTKAKKLMRSVDQSMANEIYITAIKYLSSPERKIAIIGKSYGASQTLHAASVGQDKISAAIIYYPYGELIRDKKRLSSIKAPILGHFANDDFFLSSEKLTNFTSVIKTSGLNMDVNKYNARHSFASPTSNNFQETARTLSYHRTRKFLDRYLN